MRSPLLRSSLLALLLLPIAPLAALAQQGDDRAANDAVVAAARRRAAAIAAEPWPAQWTARPAALQKLYAGAGARPLWTAGGGTTPQAQAVMTLLRDGVASRGLDARDYDPDGVEKARAAVEAGGDSVDPTRLARFDVALSRAVVNLIADLHAGRANPRGLGFRLPDSHGGINLSALVVSVSSASDPAAVVAATEPRYAGYTALEAELARYRALAADSTLRPPAAATGVLHPGDRYADAPALRRLLVALGDLRAPEAVADSLAVYAAAATDDTYTPALAGGVASFQRRHGIDADSVAGPATMAALRVPLARRVRQIELTLERWRWLPDDAPPRYVVVNVPAFRLQLFEHDPTAARPALVTNVIVGKAGQQATPAFVGTMREVVFRPYWDVPPSIARNEIVPAIRRRPGYLDSQEMEIVRGGDVNATVYPPTARNLERVLAGTLRIRQRPGPRNALGNVKFLFPNSYNVYLHSTPSQALFEETRRDFSHGCIRVEDPTALAELVLRGQAGWDRAAVEAAMNGDETIRVQVDDPVIVLILYATASVDTAGTLHFYPDVYGRDTALEKALGRGR